MRLLRWISNFLKNMWALLKSLVGSHLEEPVIPQPIPPFYAPAELVEIPYCRSSTIKWLIDRRNGILSFSSEFMVPVKTVQDWYNGRRLPRIYIIRLFQMSILYSEKWDHIKKHTSSCEAETIRIIH